MTILLNSALLNALAATLLAVLVWSAGTIPAVRRRPGLRHFLWVIVLLKLVTPPLVEFSILPAWFIAGPEPWAHPRAVPLDDLARLPVVQASDIRLEVPRTVRFASNVDWMVLLAVVSGMGTVTVLSIAIGQIWRLRRALRRGESNDKRLSRIARQSAQHLGLAVPPTVCVVSANVSPLLWVRSARPLVVIPRRLADQMSDEQLGCVVSHEIAHYLRRDHWTNLLSLFVAAICWWNPIVWWVRRELRTAQEACCDALVISRSVATRRVYAETLFQALEFIQAERALLPALASGFGGKSSTQRRFEMIANPHVNHRLSWWSYPVLLAALTALPCLPAFSQAQESADLDVPVQFRNLDPGEGKDAVVVDVAPYLITAADLDRIQLLTDIAVNARQTDLRTYKVQRSARGWVVLAFDKSTKKLAWSSEIELSQPGQASAGQRFLLHTGDGVVTIALVDGDKSLKLQELDAVTGKVTGECQLVGKSRENALIVEWKLDRLKQKQFDEELAEFDKISLGSDDGLRRGTDLEIRLPEFYDLRVIEQDGKLQYHPEVRRSHLIIGLDPLDGEKLTVQTAVDVWELIHGDAPIEQIRMSREKGKLRISVEGTVKTKKRMIIVTDAAIAAPVEDTGAETPPGGSPVR